MFMGWNSVGVLEGGEWKSVRAHLGRFVQSSMHLKSQFNAIKEAANGLADVFAQKGTQPQEVSEPLFAMAYDVLSNAVFGERSNFLWRLKETGEPDPVIHALADTMHEMTRRMASMNPLDWIYMFDRWRPSQRKFWESQRIVWTYVKQIVSRRQNDQTESFLYHLLQAAASENVVYDNVQTCMWAGHESTAAALSFLLYELSSRPDVQQKLRDEVTSVVGANGCLEYEHISRLPYVHAVVDEALRLHPPAIWTNRELQEDIKLDEVSMPKGTLVFIPTVAVHRSRLNWEDPDEFRPERFYDKQVEHGSFVPFGGGRRVCPGYKLSPFELRVSLAILALRGLRVSRQTGDAPPKIRANGAFQLCLNNYLRLSFAS
jgi:cytochrome P450